MPRDHSMASRTYSIFGNTYSCCFSGLHTSSKYNGRIPRHSPLNESIGAEVSFPSRMEITHQYLRLLRTSVVAGICPRIAIWNGSLSEFIFLSVSFSFQSLDCLGSNKRNNSIQIFHHFFVFEAHGDNTALSKYVVPIGIIRLADKMRCTINLDTQPCDEIPCSFSCRTRDSHVLSFYLQ